MRPPFRIPFRFKIVATVLVLVTTVVSLITFTMARLFRADKSAYVSDLVSVVATHSAVEMNVVLTAYRAHLRSLGRVVDDSDLLATRKTKLLAEIFASIPGLVTVRIFEGGTEVGTLTDTAGVRSGPLARAALALDMRDALDALARGERQVAIAPVPIAGREPGLLVAVRAERSGSGPALVLAGVLDPLQVISMGGGSGAFETFLVDGQGRLLHHSDARQFQRAGRWDFVPPIEPGSAATVRTFRLGNVEMLGGFARVGFEDLQAGAQIPASAADFASHQLLSKLMLVALMLLLGAAIVSLVWSARTTRSLAGLGEAAQLIGRGQFDVQVVVESRDEMGELADSFNQMASELRAREQALRRAQAQLIESEKMAAFGQLGAGIAHEVKNPLAGILGIVQLTATTLEENDPIREPLAIIEREAKRCRTIIDNLLRFARQETVAKEPIPLAGVVVATAAIMKHQMALQNVGLHTDVSGSLPMVYANANQIQQVLMNLLMNAQQAIESRGSGRVRVSAASPQNGWVELRVADDGPGIPEEIRSRIFEPFFTTKPAGRGTGLGLSVTFGIVRDHDGTVQVESTPGGGSTFVIRLPVADRAELKTDLAPENPSASDPPPSRRAA